MHNTILLQQVESIETKLKLHDKNFEKIFKALDCGKPELKQDIFFQGQIFDAYIFVSNLIKKARNNLVIIDNYVDVEVLQMLTEKSTDVSVKIITSTRASIKPLDIKKFNDQFGRLDIQYSNKYHDRFLLIDNSELYHVGASLKDLGKKCFAFSLIEDKNLMLNLIGNL